MNCLLSIQKIIQFEGLGKENKFSGIIEIIFACLERHMHQLNSSNSMYGFFQSKTITGMTLNKNTKEWKSIELMQDL